MYTCKLGKGVNKKIRLNAPVALTGLNYILFIFNKNSDNSRVRIYKQELFSHLSLHSGLERSHSNNTQYPKSGSQNYSETKKTAACSRYTSFGYGYRDYFEVQNGNFSPNYVFYLEFYVKTSSDAHVLLKPDLTEENGYEIVIGGGSNTFSQIRLITAETKKTMITQKTENFLSEQDYRMFWIAIDKLGIISVGKKEDDEVLINWRFDDPFPIRYFSFGSWTNLKADWRFGCRLNEDSEIIHEDGDPTPLRKLKHDLFTLYNPNTLPVDQNAMLEVKVNFQVNNLELNEKRGDLTVHGVADLKWMDAKIRWKPENYDGIDTIFVPPFQIWTPNMRVLNALATDKSPLFDLTTTGVVVKYDGSVFWRPPFKSVSHCAVDLKYWPFDVHNCSVLFGFWMEPDNLVLSVMEEYDVLPKEITESEWEVVEVTPFNTHEPDEGENYGVLYIKLRRTSLSGRIITAPFGAALLMALISFWLPLQSSLKLHLLCGSLFLQLITIYITGLLVPAMTRGVPKIVFIYSWSVIITCVPMIMYVILKNIQTYLELPLWLSRILSNSVFARLFCLPDVNEIVMEYSNLNDEVNKQNRNRLCTQRLVVLIDRLSFFFYLLTLIILDILV